VDIKMMILKDLKTRSRNIIHNIERKKLI
jgi:hypothetical protein